MDLDKIVKGISELSYSDLRVLAQSLSDVMAGIDIKSNSDALVPMLYDWAEAWEPEEVSASQQKAAA